MTDEAPEFDLERAWARLSLQLQWADSFWLGFVFVDDARVSETLCDRANQQLAEEGKRLSRFAPAKPEAIDDLVIDLLAGEAGDVAWLDLVRHDDGARAPGWENAWTRVLMRLNERREALRRRFSTGGVVLVTTRDRMLRTPETAPDLWSIRAWALWVASLPMLESTLREDIEIHHRDLPREFAGADVELSRQAVEQARAGTSKPRLIAALLALAGAEMGEGGVLVLSEAEALIETIDPSPGLLRVRLQAGRLWDAMGDRPKAEWSLRATSELARKLVGSDATARPLLAESLHQLGAVLAKRGQFEDAIVQLREALDIHRELARMEPDVHLSRYAADCYNLGVQLGHVGRVEESVEVLRESLDVYRVLASRRPDQFSGHVALNLGTLGVRLTRVGKHEEALVALWECRDMLRMLSEAQPVDSMLMRAENLAVIASVLNTVGRFEEAIDTAKESIELYRLEEKRAGSRDDVCGALAVLGTALLHTGEVEAAMSALEEGLRMALRSSPDTSFYFFSLMPLYRRACAAAGREPAEDLAPILARLKG